MVYLLTEDPFPMDEVARNDQRDGTALEPAKRPLKWKKMIDRFFDTALKKNKDALALGESLLGLRSCSAEYKKILPSRSQTPYVLQYVICLADTVYPLT